MVIGGGPRIRSRRGIDRRRQSNRIGPRCTMVDGQSIDHRPWIIGHSRPRKVTSGRRRPCRCGRRRRGRAGPWRPRRTFSGEKPNLLWRAFKRGRGAEGVHADLGAGLAGVLLPAEGRGLLDVDPGVDVGRDHALLILLGLVLEEVPGGHADHPGLDPLGLEGLVGPDAELDLGAGGHQEDVGLAVLGVGEDVGPLGHAGGGGVLGPVEASGDPGGSGRARRARGSGS